MFTEIVKSGLLRIIYCVYGHVCNVQWYSAMIARQFDWIGQLRPADIGETSTNQILIQHEFRKRVKQNLNATKWQHMLFRTSTTEAFYWKCNSGIM